jgi:multiple sugar transport system ATP-binding protein
LAPYPALRQGEPLAVRVRMEALHFFDNGGKRIDVGWR